jgi:hypothetical protein
VEATGAIARWVRACGLVVMIKGQKAWIRIRGAPNDPESFDLATWNGIVWEFPRVNSLGDTIHIQIADYVVIEMVPASSKPDELYRKPLNGTKKPERLP